MTPSKNLGMDLGTSGGDWLFREGELVLGPVPAKQIVEKLYAGDLDGKSEVSLLGSSQFRRLSDIDFFKLHLAKAEAKQRVDSLAQTQESTARKRRNVKIAVVATVALFAAAGVAKVAQYLAVHSFWKSADEFGDIGVSAPTIMLASARGMEEELVEYPGAGSLRPRPGGAETGTKTADRPKAARPDKAARPARPSGNVETDEDGMQTAKFDQGAINSVVEGNKRSLYPCLAAEAKKKPGLVASIPIEFVIGNEGRVAKVWVDNPSFKDGALSECLMKALQKWPFKPYEGERATVGLNFTIGKR